MPAHRPLSWIGPALFLLCLAPALELAVGFYIEALGPNPLETLTRATGLWTLRLLLITLAISPMVRFFQWQILLRYRRLFGLTAFTYGSAHLLTYLWFDQFFDWTEIGFDILERPFITAGMTAFALLVPLALTSSRRAQRAMGRAWQRLHRLVYVATVAGLLHYFWLTRADFLEPTIYAGVFVLLMLARWRRAHTVSATGYRGPD